MTITISNQKPAVLFDKPFDVLPNVNPLDSYDEYEAKIKAHMESHYVDPLFAPIITSQAASITDTSDPKNPQSITKDMLVDSIHHMWDNPTLDVQLQDQLGEIYRQSIQYHAPNDWYFEEQLTVEALTRMKLPLPSNKSGRIVQYSASVDVIPAAKGFLAQNDEVSAINWFANIAAYTQERPFNNYLLMTVQSAAVFDDIKQSVKNFMQLWQTAHTIDKDTVKLLADFDKIDLTTELSTGIFLPNGGLSHPHEKDALSFSRIIQYAMSQYEKDTTHPGTLTIQPSNLYQLYRPENIIILNLENYAHAKPADIKKDWDTFEKALNAKKILNFVSKKKLLTAKSISQNQMTGTKASSASSKDAELQRLKAQRFSGTPIPAKHMLGMMKRVIESQITRQVTQNTYKTTKKSFMRANRRNPDDINLQGSLNTTRYRPDIHIYLDTSGSISESQYRDAIANLISLTKRIKCNLYVTSFSHFVSQTSLLITKDRSTADIYNQFLAIPKVSGGTDFEQVWRKIELLDQQNKKNNASHQINFVITDFGYSLSSGHKWHKDQAGVKHTYYVPISADQYTWEHIRKWAKEFTREMVRAGDYGVRRRILM